MHIDNVIAHSVDHNTATFLNTLAEFGTVDYFFKIRQLGIRGNLLTWIDNYFSNRQQQVLIGQSHDSRSNEKKSAGVPQGSVLVPVLFLVFVNVIIDNLDSIARLFADDTSLACTISNVDDLAGI